MLPGRGRGNHSVALDMAKQVLGDHDAPPQLCLQAALRVLALVGAGEQAKAEIGSADPGEVEDDQRRARALRDFNLF